MSKKLFSLRLFLSFICSLLIGLWSIATHSLDVMAAQVASSAPTTSTYIMQDFESGGAVIQSWWNSIVTTEGPNAANAYEGDYYGRIVINGAGSTNPIFQDAIWDASQIDISSYERVCMWVFDETTIAGTHLRLILRNSDDTQGTSELRSIQSTSPGEWRKICWNLADFDNQDVMTQFFMVVLFPESLPEISGNNINSGPLRIDYVYFESAAVISCAADEVGGRIFLDQNSNTLNEASEVGYNGATVTIYDNTGASTAVTTDASGYYSTTAFSAGTDLRVELTVPTGFESAVAGNTSVLFTQAGMCEQDIGIYQTAQYCEENPQMATACYVAGTYDGDNAGLDAIVSYPYDATGIAHDGTGTPPVHAALVGDVGTTWGMGYQRQTETLYTTAFVKRLSDLGPLGTGGIYKLDYSDPSAPVVSSFANISVTLSIDTGPDPRDGTLHNASLPISGMIPVRDQNAYLNVGKVSMGDMDISDDGNTMWFVNLYDQSLYGITNLDPNTLPVPGDVLGPYDIAAENPGCNAASDVRPWGLNYSNDTVYVGLVCSAESTGLAADLHAYVLAFDPATSTFDPTPVVDFSLTERTGCPYWFSQPDACSWRPWGTAEYIEGTDPSGFNTILNPQPILADIEFDNDGSMVIAFLDRHGHQSGLQNYSGDTNDSNPNYSGMAGGDIVRICNNNGTLQLEEGGICPNGNTEHGYGGSISGFHNGIYGTAEYYQDDTVAGDPTHAESASGGLALHPSSGEVAYSTMNPLGNLMSGGIRWNSNTTGLMTRGYELYQEFLPAPAFGKATGIGDVELLCSLPNIEIGNRVWHDSNMNGIQEPGESPIPGVTVTLHNASGKEVASAVTNAQGEYYFINGSDPRRQSGGIYETMPAHVDFVGTQPWNGGLVPNADYEIRIDTTQTALAAYELTVANAVTTSTTLSDAVDSDAILRDINAVISLTTGDTGHNDHTFDFGFKAGNVGIGNRVWYDGNDNGTIDGYENGYGIDSVTVELYDSTDTLISTTTTANGGYYLFTANDQGDLLTDGDYYVRITSSNFGTPTSATPLTDWRSSSVDEADPDSDIDNNDNGIGLSAIGPIDSAIATLSIGTEPTRTVDSDNANSNLTVDFGFYDVCSDDDLGGTIWRDYNSDGIHDANEPGWINSVTVTAYNNDGDSFTTTINPDGSYDFDDIFATEEHIRLEFSGLPNWANSGVQGANSNTTVQHHTTATCDADLAVQNPDEYCQENPDLSTACFLDNTTDGKAVVSWSYNSRGTTPRPDGEALYSQVGTTWGVAYDQTFERIFTSAFLKRHAPLPDADNNNEGDLGAIYQISADANSANDTTPLWLNLDGATDSNSNIIDVGMIGDNAARGITPTPGDPSIDADAFDKVGKVGIGGIELSPDDSTLWAVNLYQKTLHGIHINPNGSAGAIDTYTLPDPCNANLAENVADPYDDTDMRPFGLEFHDGSLYIGITCSAEYSGIDTDMSAHIYRFDDNSAAFDAMSILSFDLHFAKGYASKHGDCAVTSRKWFPWTSTWPDLCGPFGRIVYPQPILSGIEFLSDGNLVVGLMDRMGNQGGELNADLTGNMDNGDSTDGFRINASGDILRATANQDGTFTIEATWTDDDATTEFFSGETNFELSGDTNHTETALGAIAYLAGSPQIVATSYNPLNVADGGTYNEGGVFFSQVADGSRDLIDQGYLVFTNTTTIPGTFGKAAGLGDLVLLCDQAPLEIGNYVWLDEDRDGIQDPCEPAIAGIDVILTASDGTTQTTTTDANGEYYFSVDPNSAYTLTIDMTQPELITTTLTTPNVDAGTTLTDGIDSDAIASGDLAVITLTTGDAGENDHTFDFGFVPETPNTITIVKQTDGTDAAFNFSSDDADLNAITITTTSASGNSAIITKTAGIYTITEDMLAGWNLIAITVTESLMNNSSTMLSSNLATLVLDAGEQITVTFHNEVMAAVQITVGNYVWVDSDLDGLQDNGEPVLSGVQVELRTISGTLVATTTTDANGFYAFTTADGLAPSTEYLIVIPDDDPVLNAGGYTSTMADQGSDDAADSDAVYLGDMGGLDWSNDGTSPFDHAIEITSPASGSNLTYDFGFTGAREYGCDSDSTITLQSNGLGSIYTSHSNTFTITNPSNVIGVIAEAGWRVNFDGTDLPTEATFTGSNGTTATVTDGKLIETVAYNNNPGKFNTTIYRSYLAGNMSSVTLTTPLDGSGDPFAFNLYVLRSTGGEGQASNLFFIDKFTGSVDDDLPQSATTIAPLSPSPVSSNYTFLAPIGEAGTKGAQINLSAGGVDNSGNDVYPEPSPNPYGSDVYIQEMSLTNIPANTGSLNLFQAEAPSSQSSFILTGFIATAEACSENIMIGNRVWIEDDNDGLATTGVITPVVGTVVTAVGSDGTVYTDATDTLGYYTITVPANGIYTVTVNTPVGTAVAVPAGGLVAVDNDPTTDDDTSHDPAGTATTVGTEDNFTIDFGFYELPSGTPSLAISKMLNTPEPVTVSQPISFTIRITNTGNVTITTLPLMDAYDTIYLAYDSVNGSTLATDNNSNDGQLEWSDLTATEGDLAPGETIEVIVRFTALADTAALATQSPCTNAGESCNVAAVNNATAGPDSVPPVEDSDDVAIEELITGKSTLGDFVWYDTNGDGIKDPGEPGINGVIINLYDSTGLITTTVTMSDTGGIGDDTGATNGDGFYDFEVLPSTVYTVEIDPSNFDPGGALEGYSYTGNNGTMPHNGDETRVVIMPADQHDENNVDFSYVAPHFELSKVLNTPPPARVNDVVSFTIRITNTGTTVITTVPLTDIHNSAYLSYITASPLPDTPGSGELIWHDLTATGASGFGTDLNPGETFEIVVEFLAKLDTTLLPNERTINLASSQGISDTAEVPIFAPTSVQLSAQEVIYKDGSVILRWETADETNVVGFHIYRQLVGNGEPMQLTKKLLIAEKSGSLSGGAYTYEDETAQANVDYRYFVGILDTNDLEARSLLGDMSAQRTFNEWFIFLPITLK